MIMNEAPPVTEIVVPGALIPLIRGLCVRENRVRCANIRHREARKLFSEVN